jgi:hypothetical protein
LHTNFRLGDEGEYLGFIAPDGQTVLQQFNPGYPGQRNGISHGIPQSSTTTELVTARRPPPPSFPVTKANATWMQPEFVPAGWQAGVAAIGRPGHICDASGKRSRNNLFDRNGGAYYALRSKSTTRVVRLFESRCTV